MLDEHGAITERRIHTTRERLAAVLGDRPPARVLLESGTESEWVARYLESLGHAVIVADPNFATTAVTGTVLAERHPSP
jgi:transposase